MGNAVFVITYPRRRCGDALSIAFLAGMHVHKTHQHCFARQAALTEAWVSLQQAGNAAPLDADLLYHTVIGAASLLYSNAPEAELMGIQPSDPERIERHADALVSILLTP